MSDADHDESSEDEFTGEAATMRERLELKTQLTTQLNEAEAVWYDSLPNMTSKLHCKLAVEILSLDVPQVH